MKTDSDLNLISYTMDGFLESISTKEIIDWPSDFLHEDKLNFIDEMIDYYLENDNYANCTILQKIKERL